MNQDAHNEVYRRGEDRVREVGRIDDRLPERRAGEVRPTPAAHLRRHMLVSWV